MKMPFEERDRWANPAERIRGIAAVIDGMAPGGLDRARHELRHHVDALEAELERFVGDRWDLMEAIREHRQRAIYQPQPTEDLMERIRNWDRDLYAELDRIDTRINDETVEQRKHESGGAA